MSQLETKTEWLAQQLVQLAQESKGYKQKALLLAARDLLMEQGKRIEQARGQLDGELWSPNQWGE